MLDIIQRYYPVVKLLEGVWGQKIIDVGSGNLGIAPFLDWRKNKIILFDDYFVGYRLSGVTYKKGSILRMPFSKDDFDLAVCIDALEHISPIKRKKAVVELLRIAKRKVILSFPEGERSNQAERFINYLFENLFRRKHLFLKDHLKYGLPKQKVVVSLIKKNFPKAKIRVERKTNLYIWMATMLLSFLIAAPPILFDRFIGKKNFSLTFWTQRLLFFLFGWTSPFLNFGPCYRILIVVEK